MASVRMLSTIRRDFLVVNPILSHSEQLPLIFFLRMMDLLALSILSVTATLSLALVLNDTELTTVQFTPDSLNSAPLPSSLPGTDIAVEFLRSPHSFFNTQKQLSYRFSL